MKKLFWLSDVNSEVRGQKPEVWIWDIDDKGQRILIIEQNFPAYFYLVVKEGYNTRSVTEAITARQKEFSLILKLESVRRRYFGKPVDTPRAGYVITLGTGKLYEKAKPYVLASYDEVDTEYYVTNQIVPAASRILSMFEITEEELLPAARPKAKTLADFSE